MQNSQHKKDQKGSSTSQHEDAQKENPRAVQLKRDVAGLAYKEQKAALQTARPLIPTPVQAKGKTGGAQGVKQAAAGGVKGGGSRLPHAGKIQKAFGRHDISGIRAHTGTQARKANESIGSQAYASGSDVAFKSSSPDLHTTAHEAAHVVQQAGGVQLKGGVGQAGDKYEKHADAVADRVVQGKSAEGLLDTYAGGSGGGSKQSVQGKGEIQFTGHDLDEALPEDAESPGHSNDRGATKQRQYTVEQYVAMWEEERGKVMTDQEKSTLARGCIGITAINVEAVNPPLDHSYATFDQAKAVVDEWNAFIAKHKGEKTAAGEKVGDFKAFLFAKLFWSNQSPDQEERKKPDEEAYKPDPKTGKVDMSDYKYRAQPGHINFDYGFWDEDTQSFWHANHAQPGMKVYQSTKEKFSAGYIDFDRVIYCAAIAKSYKPAGAARNAG